VPEADPATLKRPADAARELANAIVAACRDLHTPPLYSGATTDVAPVTT